MGGHLSIPLDPEVKKDEEADLHDQSGNKGLFRIAVFQVGGKELGDKGPLKRSVPELFVIKGAHFPHREGVSQ